MKKIALTLVFFIFIGVFSLGTLLTPDKAVSENENRPLAQLPKASVKKALNGELQAGIKDWFSDQLFLRDGLIAGKTTLQKLTGKKDIGGVYLADGGFYIKKTTESDLDPAVYQKNLAAVEYLFKNSGLGEKHQSLMLVPPASHTLHKLLPTGAEVFNAESRLSAAKKISGGRNIDTTQVLSENPQNKYYKTDHHWTSNGAYSAYTLYCKETGLQPITFSKEIVSSDFLGTLHSKVLDPAAKKENLYSYRHKNDKGYLFSIGGKPQTGGIYCKEKLNTKDKYAYFFGGNYGIATIENCGGKGHLLVIKDSFANCFLPLVAPHYEKVTIIDPRFYLGSVNQTIKTQGVTDILVLYGLETFVEDKSVPLVTG